MFDPKTTTVHERDEQLGRWRWPEEPDYVVYPDDCRLRVLRERDGTFFAWTRGDATRAVKDEGDTGGAVNAAYAYSEAHPEPMPWESAKPGEVWVLHLEGTPVPLVRSEKNWLNTLTGRPAVVEGRVGEGRRIWPEGD